MTNLHVVYRVDDPGTPAEQWSSYSFPQGVYVTGATLDEVRSEFRSAAAFAFPDLDQFTVIEHLERPLAPGAYIRTAVDRRTLDRDATERIMRSSLQLVDQWHDFQDAMPLVATGDTVMITCVPDDLLSWIFEQMTVHDAIGMCALGQATATGQLIWWSFIVGELAAAKTSQNVEPLSAAGLSDRSTVSDFMQATATATGRQLAGSGSG
jgi:hypothetical protein